MPQARPETCVLADSGTASLGEAISLASVGANPGATGTLTTHGPVRAQAHLEPEHELGSADLTLGATDRGLFP